MFAVVLTTTWPSEGELFTAGVRTALIATSLVSAGFAIAVLGGSGVRFGSWWVRSGWRVITLSGLTLLCLSIGRAEVATVEVPAFLVLWTAWTWTAWWVQRSVTIPSIAQRRWVLMAPWVVLGAWTVAVSGSFESAVSLANSWMATPLYLVVFGALGLVPGLLVRESVTALNAGRVIQRLEAGGPRGVWLLMAVKAVLVGVLLTLNWSSMTLAWAEWLRVLPGVGLLLGLLAFDHRLPAFQGRLPQVAGGLGLLVSLPICLIAFAGMGWVLLHSLVLRQPVPILLGVATLVLTRLLDRGNRMQGWRGVAAPVLVGMVLGVAAVTAALGVPPMGTGRAPAVSNATLAALFIAAFAVVGVVIVGRTLLRRAWPFVMVSIVLALWLAWWGTRSTLTPRGEFSSFVLVNVLLLTALSALQILAQRGRQHVIDSGEILRFALATLFAVDVPILLLWAPDTLDDLAKAAVFAVPGVSILAAQVRRRLRLRPVALVAAVFAPLCIADLLTAGSLLGPAFSDQIESLASGAFLIVALPLAALVSMASARVNEGASRVLEIPNAK